jgi:hypothetical protein
MKLVTMHGAAPDGSGVTVTVDVELADHEMCTVMHGMACCTLSNFHAGPWHVATTEDSIVAVWAVDA